MVHNRGRGVWAVLAAVVMVCSGPSLAVVGMGIVAASAAAEALAAAIEALQREMVQESASDANRAKLFNKLKEAREQLMPIKEHNEETVKGVKGRIAELEQMYGGADPAGWKATDRAEYERTKQALEQVQGVQGKLDAGWENLKWLQNRQGVREFNPFKNQTFQDKLKELGSQVTDVAEAYKSFGDTYNVETATLDPGSTITVVKATHVTVRNDSKDVLFKVAMSLGAEPVTLKPGESQPFRLGDHGCIAVRAMSWDPTRQQVLTVAQRFADGEMKTAKLHEKSLPYFIHYGAGNLSTLIRSEKEEYKWAWGRNIASAAGQTSPWAPTSFTTPQPQLSSTHPNKEKDVPAVVDDQVVWYIPAVENGTVEFGFEVMGTVEWLTQRRMANGQETDKTDSVVCGGTLNVVVAP